MLLFLGTSLVAVRVKKFRTLLLFFIVTQAMLFFLILNSSSGINDLYIVGRIFTISAGILFFLYIKNVFAKKPEEQARQIQKKITQFLAGFLVVVLLIIGVLGYFSFQKLESKEALNSEQKLMEDPFLSRGSNLPKEKSYEFLEKENETKSETQKSANIYGYDSFGSDKTAYLEKIEILQALVRTLGSKPDSMHKMCMLMSIGNDVNARYLEFNANDTEERKRGEVMADQLSMCLAALSVRNKTE